MDSLWAELAAIGTVFGWSFFSFWSAIPAGIALGLSPLIVVVTVTVSYGVGAALVVIVGAPLRDRIRKRMAKPRAEGESGEIEAEPSRMVVMVQNAWTRYGLLGLSLLAPMTVGSQIGAVIGLGFGARPWRLVMAMTLGSLAWAVLIGGAVVAGLVGVSQL